MAKARAAARRSAAMIPISSISSDEACPTALIGAQRSTRGTSFSRAAGVSSFESRTPVGADLVSRSTTTTPTVTGPARAPRPTSSIPATKRCPSRSSLRSSRSVGGWAESFFSRARLAAALRALAR